MPTATRFVMLLIIASAVMSIRPPEAAAGMLQVCPSGCPYTSIQSAINAAQTGDRIIIAAGTYTENLLMFAPLAAKTLTLMGRGAARTIVNGNLQDCVLQIDTGYTVTVRDMTLTNGDCDAAGGVVNHGTMTLTNVSLSHNVGEQTGGGISNDVDSTLTLISSTVSDNTTKDPGSGQGGGIFNLGTVSLTRTTVSGNSAPAIGGGIENRGRIRIIDSRISDNSTQGVGGGIESHDSGAGTATVTLSNTPIINNEAFTGGGIYNNSVLTITGSPIHDNTAGEGGGLENSFLGVATLTNSPVSRNTATTDGGGVANDRGKLTMTNCPVDNNAAVSSQGAKGGGVAVFGGTVELKGSPVTRNGASGPIGGLGGGIVITDAAVLTLRNSPVDTNSASTAGGGIYSFSGIVNLQNSPVRRNQPNNCVNVPGC